jgi:antitoxin (DNA-binding transcriptional repressor) of toxin-antitoxin stability system
MGPMARLDLDDLPPKIAAQLTQLADGEELVLVQHGAVVGRLTAAAAATMTPKPLPPIPPDQEVREVFETFRAAIEDEF